MRFYAVHKGRNPGVYRDWKSCKEQVNKFKGAIFKSFPTSIQAKEFFLNGPKISTKLSNNVTHKNKSKYKSCEEQVKIIPGADSKLFPTEKQGKDYVLKGKSISTEPCSSTNVTQKNKSKYIPKINSSKCFPKKKRSFDRSTAFEKALKLNLDDPNIPIVYTDGACSENGKKNARAGYGVWWGDGNPLNLSCKLEGLQTNNRGEIAAVDAAIKQAIKQKYKKIVLCTDSTFVIDSITKYSQKWIRNNWTKLDGNQVIHKKEFSEILNNLKSVEVIWKHVKAHRGIRGNEMADKLAVSGRKIGFTDDLKNGRINSSNCLKRKISFDDSTEQKSLKLDEDIYDPIAYTGGACSNNGSKNARAGYGVWWGLNEPLNLSCKLEGKQTNYRAQIAAVNAAIKQAIEQGFGTLIVCTDSMYVINCITKYSSKWKRNNWRKVDGSEVKHKKEFIEILERLKSVKVIWKHVRAHSGNDGSDMAEKLAISGSNI